MGKREEEDVASVENSEFAGDTERAEGLFMYIGLLLFSSNVERQS